MNIENVHPCLHGAGFCVLGVRWDGATMPAAKNNREAIFDPNLSRFPGDALGAYRQAGVGGAGNSVINPDLATFAPRVGFAYRPRGLSRVVLRGGFGIFYALAFVGQEEQFLTVNLPFFFLSTPSSQGPQSYVRTTDLFPAPPPLYPDPSAKFVAEGQRMYTIPQNIRFPRSNQWNFAVQTLITPTLSLETAYVGDSSHHIQARWDINQARLPSAAEVASGNFSQLATRKAYPDLGSIISSPYWGNSNYNALQAKLEKRFSHGISFLGSYAWGKAIDDVEGEDQLHVGEDGAASTGTGEEAAAAWNPPAASEHEHIWGASVSLGERQRPTWRPRDLFGSVAGLSGAENS